MSLPARAVYLNLLTRVPDLFRVLGAQLLNLSVSKRFLNDLRSLETD